MPKRSNASYTRRRVGSRTSEGRQPIEVILIVCEGKQTEPNYFEGFPVPKQVREIFGLGMDPLKLVQEAKKLAESYARDRGYRYGQVWCVFDRDIVPLERFNQALSLARDLEFCVAYSNPCFEIWYLLHFTGSDRPMQRHDCKLQLAVHLGCPYDKSRPWYSRLQSSQELAIRRAAKLLTQYEPPDPANDNPSTTVHRLVQELNKRQKP